MEDKSIQKELDPKEEISAIIKLLVLLGIISLVMQGIKYLGDILTDVISSIGNIIINIFSGIPVLVTVAIILFIAAGILWMSNILAKDENDLTLYEVLTLFIWIAGILSIFILSVNSILSANRDYSHIVGFGFIILIAPPIIFLIIKGIRYLRDNIFNNG